MIFIIDGSYIAYRSYHAYKKLEVGEEANVGAIYGFIKNLITLNKHFNPEKFIVAWDKGSKRRKEESPEYKANRASGHGNAVYEQIAIIRLLLFDLGVEQADLEGYEADDVIGALVDKYADAGEKVCIVSADHDLKQLVRTGVVFLKSLQSIQTVNTIKDDYGLEPAQLLDVWALSGDTSDNIKGVPSIGEKTATKLVKAYGSVDEMFKLEAGDDKKLQKVLDNKDVVTLAKSLITLDRDIEPRIVPGEKTLGIVRYLFEKYLKFSSFIAEWEEIEKLGK